MLYPEAYASVIKRFFGVEISFIRNLLSYSPAVADVHSMPAGL